MGMATTPSAVPLCRDDRRREPASRLPPAEQSPTAGAERTILAWDPRAAPIRARAHLRQRFVGLLFTALVVVPGAAWAADADAQAFLAENAAAMDRMMAAMHVTPSGDVDRDFVAMMVPHHQGAIDMARAQLRYGRNERLRRIAQEIVVTQEQEIAVMRRALGNVPPPAAGGNSHAAHGHGER